MHTAVKLLGGGLALVALAAGAGLLWVYHGARSALSEPVEVHQLSLPTPEGEALQEAAARGEHLVQARYFCTACHGADLGGGVMVDAAPIGTLRGPNLTSGPGSAVAQYSMSDWDRIVRHGVKPGGEPSVMPSEDYRAMSNQELIDVVAYIKTRPPVDNEVSPTVSLGPVGAMLIATGQWKISAFAFNYHDQPHLATPPAAAASAEFGGHILNTCTGCHGADFSGGPIAGGDPSWPPAANLTPHEDGLAGWTYENFARSMREGRTADGRPFEEPMSDITPYVANMTETELQAMWAYLSELPSRPTGG